MKEQKTLGDLSKSLRTTDRSARLEHFGMNKFELPDGIKGISCGAYLEYDEVKEEAIKWINLLEHHFEKAGNYKSEYLKFLDDTIGRKPTDNDDCEIITTWIKYFFNITEKDLKLNLKI